MNRLRKQSNRNNALLRFSFAILAVIAVLVECSTYDGEKPVRHIRRRLEDGQPWGDLQIKTPSGVSNTKHSDEDQPWAAIKTSNGNSEMPNDVSNNKNNEKDEPWAAITAANGSSEMKDVSNNKNNNEEDEPWAAMKTANSADEGEPWAAVKTANDVDEDGPWAATKTVSGVDEDDPWAATKTVSGVDEDDPWTDTKAATGDDADDPWADVKTANGYTGVSVSQMPNAAYLKSDSSHEHDTGADEPWAATKTANGAGEDKHQAAVDGFDEGKPWATTQTANTVEDEPWAATKTSNAIDEDEPWAATKAGYGVDEDEPWAATKAGYGVDEDEPWAATKTANGYTAVSVSQMPKPNGAYLKSDSDNDYETGSAMKTANGYSDDEPMTFGKNDALGDDDPLRSPNHMTTDRGSSPGRNDDKANNKPYPKSSSKQGSLVISPYNPDGLSKWEMASMDEYMAIVDVTHDRFPVGIENDAPDHSFFVNRFGNVGFGTDYPEANLHVVAKYPSIRLQDEISPSSSTASSENPKQRAWNIAGTRDGFSISEETLPPGGYFSPPRGNLTIPKRTLPFSIDSGAPSYALVVDKHGQVGLGTDSPLANLHVMGSARVDGTFQVVGGPHGSCVLDTHTCEFKKQFRRQRSRARNMKGVGGQEEAYKSYDEDEQDGVHGKDLELLKKQNSDLQERLEMLETTGAQREARLVERIEAMEDMITDLITKLQEVLEEHVVVT